MDPPPLYVRGASRPSFAARAEQTSGSLLLLHLRLQTRTLYRSFLFHTHVHSSYEKDRYGLSAVWTLEPDGAKEVFLLL